MSFDYEARVRPDLPPPVQRWGGFPTYNFIGGHNDADSIPVDELAAAAARAIGREGRKLATYGLDSGPQGYRPLREFVAAKLGHRAHLPCTVDEVLITSGSNQGLELVSDVFLAPGDTLLVEASTYGGALSRLKRQEANIVGVELDGEGMRADSLDAVLTGLKAKGIEPKYVYTIPTVQNPTGMTMGRERRLELLRVAAAHDMLIVEDDCYADLLWGAERPPAIRALDEDGRVIYVGSFSKSISPALRVGYVVADWPVLSRLLPLKTDGGTGALEQLMLAEYCPEAFDAHAAELTETLRDKCATMVVALEEQFGASAEFHAPNGGIFVWITLPDAVDTSKLALAASAEGVAINPGAEWVAEPEHGRHSLRLCFGHATKDEIREGVARLAEICHRETGIPIRGANVTR